MENTMRSPSLRLTRTEAARTHLTIVPPALEVLAPRPVFKPAVDPATLVHKQLLGGEFWRKIPAYAEIDEAVFLDHSWQARHSITRAERLFETLKDIASPEFMSDAALGFSSSPMSVRLSPYLVSLIDWSRPYEDPLRRQFIPVKSRLLADHPRVGLDSLNEQGDSPVPGLTHRYADKALFLALDRCPVYCRFCTRSCAVGVDTDEVEKINLPANAQRWRDAVRLHRLAPRDRGHRRLGRRPTSSAPRRSPKSATRRWRCPTCGASASPPRGWP